MHCPCTRAVFVTGEAQYPVERVLLTSGILAAAIDGRFSALEKAGLSARTALQNSMPTTQSVAAVAGERQETPAATTRLYHGTSFEAAISIQRGGFRVGLAGTNAGARLGPGVYCSTTLKKALSYAGGHAGEGIIFVMDVALGRCADAS